MSLRGGGQGRDGEEVNGFGAWLGGVDLGGGVTGKLSVFVWGPGGDELDLLF